MNKDQILERMKYWFNICCETVANSAAFQNPVICDNGYEAGKDHPLVKLLNNPNPIDSGWDMLYKHQLSIEKNGVSYLWLIPDGWNKVCEMWHIDPKWIKTPTTTGRIDRYEVRTDPKNPGCDRMFGSKLLIPLEEILVETGFYNPVRGMLQNRNEKYNWDCIDTEEKIQRFVLDTFKIPKAAVGLVKEISYRGVLYNMSSFGSQCLDPRLLIRGNLLTEKIAKRFGDCKIHYESTVPKDPEKVNEDIRLLRECNAITPNDIRKMKGLKPFVYGGNDPILANISVVQDSSVKLADTNVNCTFGSKEEFDKFNRLTNKYGSNPIEESEQHLYITPSELRAPRIKKEDQVKPDVVVGKSVAVYKPVKE